MKLTIDGANKDQDIEFAQNDGNNVNILTMNVKKFKTLITIEELQLVINTFFPKHTIGKSFSMQNIERAYKSLTQREQKIITLLYGIKFSEKTHNLEKVSKIFGVTRDRIVQLETKATRTFIKVLNALNN